MKNNKIIIPILVLILILVFSFLISSKEKPKKGWATYESNITGYSVNYPLQITEGYIEYYLGEWSYTEDFQKSDYHPSKTNVFFGPQKNREKSWTISSYDKSDYSIEDSIRDKGKHFGNARSESRENIKINNIPALLVTITNDTDLWESVSIYIEKSDEIIIISGHGRIKEFEDFYKSFRFIN